MVLYVLAALSLCSLALPAGAQVPPEYDAGWQSDVGGLRHFTGLRCPDMIGPFYRVKVMKGDGVSLAGCVYTGRDGISAVLRKHLPDTGRQQALTFSRNYKAAGFDPIKLSGAAASGISFRTSKQTPGTLCETLWYFYRRRGGLYVVAGLYAAGPGNRGRAGHGCVHGGPCRSELTVGRTEIGETRGQTCGCCF
ncbi:hypothetical protein QW131_13995 [Roseibium salinum]|nr:hypothetical protein [Roseibium salinum]